MTLPLAGNTINISQVNTELTRPATSLLNLGDPAVRALFVKPSGPISMSDGWGKSFNNFTLGFTGPSAAYCNVGGSMDFVWWPDGSYSRSDASGTMWGSWGSPTTSQGSPTGAPNIGVDYETMINTPSIMQLGVRPYGVTRSWDTWYPMNNVANLIYVYPAPTAIGYTKFTVSFRHLVTHTMISKDFFLVCN